MPSGWTPFPPKADAHVGVAMNGFRSRTSEPPPPSAPATIAGVVSTSLADRITLPAGTCPTPLPNTASNLSIASCCRPGEDATHATAAAANPPVGRDCTIVASTEPA